MSKNLVIIHLESLSNFIYNMNKDFFPNLSRLAVDMEYYSNYYSTATSTQMVISDLFMGRMDVFESATYLENIYEVQHSETPILLSLRDKGYVTKYYVFGNTDSDKELIVKFHDTIDRGGSLYLGYNNRKNFHENIRGFINENLAAPFALFIKDLSSHIGSKTDDFDKTMLNTTRCFRERYMSIDKTVGMVFDELKKNKLLNNTLIVLYGDHGDEPYIHSFHKGYLHAIEPFCDMINCPLFIYDSGHVSKSYNNVISTVDLRKIIESRLAGESEVTVRKYAFSRNLFAAQRKKADVFNKAYGVTDGEYTMIITKDGLALYLNCVDPLSMKNLLDFYVITHGELKYNTVFDNIKTEHYCNFMSDILKNEIEKKFYELKEVLQEKVESEVYLSDTFSFDIINYGMSKKDINNCKTSLTNIFCRVCRKCINTILRKKS